MNGAPNPCISISGVKEAFSSGTNHKLRITTSSLPKIRGYEFDSQALEGINILKRKWKQIKHVEKNNYQKFE